MRRIAIAAAAFAASSVLAAGAAGAFGSAHSHSAATNSSLAFDENYLSTSIQGDRFEIAGGKLALQKSQNATVRPLATTLITDHSKSLRESKTLANALHTAIPHSPSFSQTWELKVVSSFSGAEFDRWYSDLEVQDHKQDIAETSDEIHNGRQPHVRQSARRELPVLKKHLQLSKAALKAAGG
jgi:putative membrane protein